MNTNPPDDLDRVIDEALSSMMNETPRRVSAASVRQALEPRRRSVLPVWLAVAAVLIIGFVVILRRPHETQETPRVAVSTTPAVVPGSEISTRLEPSAAVQKTAAGRTLRTPRRAISEDADSAAEGVPRLVIASLDPPDPLNAPKKIDAETLLIPRIEIAPLAVAALSPDPEINPPTK
jgi:hypothetical protein